MGKPMEATAGNGQARECENGCGGGSAWRITPASGVLTSSASYGSTQLAQSDQGGELILTKGAGWGLLQRKTASSGIRRRIRVRRSGSGWWRAPRVF